MLKRNSSIILIILFTLLLIALVIWWYDKRIKNIEKKMKPVLSIEMTAATTSVMNYVKELQVHNLGICKPKYNL